MEDAEKSDRASPKSLVAIAAAAIVGGGSLGALTNAVNGAVSPEYFRTIMRWGEIESLWRAAVAQGIFEGLIYGTLAAIVLMIVVGVVAGARCQFREVRGRLLAVFAGVLGCWVLGGLLAMGLATLSPDFYRNAFIGVPEEYTDMIAYAWVGGSIWGAMFGAVLNLVIGSVLIATDWRRSHPVTEE